MIRRKEASIKAGLKEETKGGKESDKPLNSISVQYLSKGN